MQKLEEQLLESQCNNLRIPQKQDRTPRQQHINEMRNTISRMNDQVQMFEEQESVTSITR